MATDPKLVTAELAAGQAAVRSFFSTQSLGYLVSDETCLQIASAVVTAVDDIRESTKGPTP